jgi:hypothetical protein
VQSLLLRALEVRFVLFFTFNRGRKLREPTYDPPRT